VAVATTLVVVAGLQTAAASPAVALPALQVVIADYEYGYNQDNPKWVEANCPPGKLVVGGGGQIQGRQDWRFFLTGLEPKSAEGLKPSRFVASAVAATSSDPNRPKEKWSMQAVALCVDAAAIQPYQIVSHLSLPTSGVFMSDTARCPAGTVAYSAGGSAPDPWGGFGLQMVRTSGPLDIGRATVRAASSSVSQAWRMTTHVVCGPRKDGIAAYGNITDGSSSGLQCPAGQQIHGAGGGLGLSDGGFNWLRNLFPARNGLAMTVQMAVTSLGLQTVAHATCAARTS
jgi:hypothetical protein